jgi:hypothetical protein
MKFPITLLIILALASGCSSKYSKTPLDQKYIPSLAVGTMSTIDLIGLFGSAPRSTSPMPDGTNMLTWSFNPHTHSKEWYDRNGGDGKWLTTYKCFVDGKAILQKFEIWQSDRVGSEPRFTKRLM